MDRCTAHDKVEARVENLEGRVGDVRTELAGLLGEVRMLKSLLGGGFLITIVTNVMLRMLP